MHNVGKPSGGNQLHLGKGEKKKKPLALGKEHEYKLGAALNMKVQENVYRPYSKTQNQRTSLKVK